MLVSVSLAFFQVSCLLISMLLSFTFLHGTAYLCLPKDHSSYSFITQIKSSGILIMMYRHSWSIISLGNSLRSELWNKHTKPEKQFYNTSLPVSTQVYFFALLLNFIWYLSIIYEDPTQRYLPSPEYQIMFEFWLMIIQVFPTGESHVSLSTWGS